MSTVANPEIFKAYDIRGLYGSDIDAALAELIGRAFARVIAELEDKPTAELRLGLGRDMRLTAPEMAKAYCAGMVRGGRNRSSTPARSAPRCSITSSGRGSSTAD